MKTLNSPIRLVLLAAIALQAGVSAAQKLEVEEYILPNGMKFLLVPRGKEPNVATGWIAKVGSVNEKPGITGLSHLFEHMMFKGSKTIGTSDYEKEKAVLADLDATRNEIEDEQQKLVERKRRGEIDNLLDPSVRTPRHQELLKRLEELTARSKSFIVKDEFDKIYTGAGGAGMNASTSNDFTIYFIQTPANKLELWFWMESERLLNPIFREFYSERDVVYEERRMRTDSTPTGKFQEQFNSLFWQSSPYSWPVIGWPSDIEGITREEALDYYAVNYAPNNLTACLVGDFDPKEVKALADKYFGRLKRGPREPEPVRTVEMPQLAEKRMFAYADTNPSVQIRFHTVADGHADEPALSILASILNGTTGRLYKSLVLDQKIATSANAGQNGYRFEGYFGMSGVARQGKTPEEVEQAILKEIEKLKSEPVGERELQKVKNQELVSRFRNLESNFPLLFELMVRDVSRNWKTIQTDPALYQAVTADDVMRVAKKYMTQENRAVAVFYRKGEKKEEEIGKSAPEVPKAKPDGAVPARSSKPATEGGSK